MNCKNCGASLSETDRECPFCGTPVEQTTDLPNAVVEVVTSNVVAQSDVNPLLDKEYKFSGNDLVIRGRWGVNTNVKVGDDRLYFETVPARKNVMPALMLEDIMAIENKFHMRTINIILAAIGVAFCFTGVFYTLILTGLVLLFYRERKLVIHLRNGNKLTIYSGNKEIANQFVADMKTITKIQ